jgi:histidinol phosphatase-like PHP family hydrolase
MRINLHNHTTWSDGASRPAELAATAAAVGITHLGITDHFATAKLDPSMSVGPDRLDAYVADIRAVADVFRPRLRVLAGLEVDFSFQRTDLEYLMSAAQEAPAFRQLDFLLFEYVGQPGEGSLEEFLSVRSRLRAPTGLAHPYLSGVFGGWMDPFVLARTLAEADVFVEICCDPALRRVRGPRRGETGPVEEWAFDDGSEWCREFWHAAAEVGLRVSIGSDTHGVADGVADIEPALAFVRRRRLEGLVIARHLWRYAADSPAAREA